MLHRYDHSDMGTACGTWQILKNQKSTSHIYPIRVSNTFQIRHDSMIGVSVLQRSYNYAVRNQPNLFFIFFFFFFFFAFKGKEKNSKTLTQYTKHLFYFFFIFFPFCSLLLSFMASLVGIGCHKGYWRNVN